MAEKAIRYKTLSIRRTADGFCFMSHSKSDRPDIRFIKKEGNSVSEAEFAGILKESGFIPADFARVLFIPSEKNYTLVPSSLFIESEATSLLKFAQPKTPTGASVMHYPAPQMGAEIIYSLDGRTKDAVSAVIPDVRFIPHISPMLQYLMTIAKGGTVVWINIEEGVADIMVADDGKLLLADSRKHISSYDTLYAVMGAIKSFQLQKSEILLSGDTEDISQNLTRMAGRVTSIQKTPTELPVDLRIILQ